MAETNVESGFMGNIKPFCERLVKNHYAVRNSMVIYVSIIFFLSIYPQWRGKPLLEVIINYFIRFLAYFFPGYRYYVIISHLIRIGIHHTIAAAVIFIYAAFFTISLISEDNKIPNWLQEDYYKMLFLMVFSVFIVCGYFALLLHKHNFSVFDKEFKDEWSSVEIIPIVDTFSKRIFITNNWIIMLTFFNMKAISFDRCKLEITEENDGLKEEFSWNMGAVQYIKFLKLKNVISVRASGYNYEGKKCEMTLPVDKILKFLRKSKYTRVHKAITFYNENPSCKNILKRLAEDSMKQLMRKPPGTCYDCLETYSDRFLTSEINVFVCGGNGPFCPDTCHQCTLAWNTRRKVHVIESYPGISLLSECNFCGSFRFEKDITIKRPINWQEE